MKLSSCPVTGLLIMTLSAAAPAGDWPGWRGDGSGVSADAGLPTEWDADKNIRWKTRIDGAGISSPIVWGDRVFVTTAVEDAAPSVPRWTAPVAAAGLFAFGLMTLVFGRRRTVLDRMEPSRRVRWLAALDRGATMMLTLAFAAGLAASAWDPDRLASQGAVSRAWIVSGAIGAMGLLAAVGWTRTHGNGRVIGALLLGAAAAAFCLQAPLDMYTIPIPAKKLAAVSGPVAMAAVWHLFLFAVSRGTGLPANPGRVARLRSVGPLLMAVAAGVVFTFFNHMRPGEGLLRCVVCLDRDSGGVLWMIEAFCAPPERKHYMNTYATPTPVTDGAFVAANFGPGLVCMDYDGNVLWRRMETAYSEHLRYGAAISPVMHGDAVIHAFLAEWSGDEAAGQSRDYARDSYVAAFDKKTGRELWRWTPPGAFDSYSSPVVIGAGDSAALVLATWEHAAACDPRTGRPLWTCRVPIEQAVPSIVADADAAYVAGGTHGPSAAVAVPLGQQGEIPEDDVRWIIKKGVPECSSPVLYDGLLYWVTESGVASCIDPATGETIWKKRLNGHYVASLAAGGGLVYFTSLDGAVTVLKAGTAFTVLSRNVLDEEVRASPALAGGRLYLRGTTHLYCIENVAVSDLLTKRNARADSRAGPAR